MDNYKRLIMSQFFPAVYRGKVANFFSGQFFKMNDFLKF